MPVTEQSATESLALLNKGELSSVELTQAYLDVIEANDKSIGAFLRLDAEAASCARLMSTVDAKQASPLASSPVCPSR